MTVFKKQYLKRYVIAGMVFLIITLFLLSCMLSSNKETDVKNEEEQLETQISVRFTQVAKETTFPIISLAMAIENYEQQSMQASRLELEEELANSANLISINKLDRDLFNGYLSGGKVTQSINKCGAHPYHSDVVLPIMDTYVVWDCKLFSTWEVTNNSKFSVLVELHGYDQCAVVKDIYQQQIIEYSGYGLYPGITRVFDCQELEFWGMESSLSNLNPFPSSWHRYAVSFSAKLENQLGRAGVWKTFSYPNPKRLVLSELVNISIQELPTALHTGLLEFTIIVDKRYPYFLFISEISTIPFSEQHGLWPDTSWLLEENYYDNRILEETTETHFFAIGEIHTRYMYLYNGLNPESICFELDAYTHRETICVNLP